MTKMEKFEAVKAILVEQEAEMELIEEVEKEIERLQKRKDTPKKPSKADLEKKAESERLRGVILESMEPDTQYGTVDLKELVPDLGMASPQKISSLMKVLVESGKVIKGTVRRATVWQLI